MPIIIKLNGEVDAGVYEQHIFQKRENFKRIFSLSVDFFTDKVMLIQQELLLYLHWEVRYWVVVAVVIVVVVACFLAYHYYRGVCMFRSISQDLATASSLCHLLRLSIRRLKSVTHKELVTVFFRIPSWSLC